MSDVKELNISNTTYDIKAKSVVDTNNGKLKFWSGTRAEYDAIVTKDANTLYNVEGVGLYKGTTLISGAMPNSANQSLSNLDSAGQDKFDAKVNKSGDTMTGDLTIRPDSSPHIYLQNSNFTKGTNPSSNIYWEYRAEDSNTNPAEWYTNRVGNFVTTVFTDGTVETAMFAYQNNQNANTAASIYTRITQAGVASCSFPNTTCCDGQWVTLNQKIISSSTSLVGSSNLSYTVNVPNDGHYYEIIVEGQLRSNATKNYWGSLQVITSFGGFMIAQAKSETDTVNDGMSCVTIPLGTNRNLQVQRQKTSSNFQCACLQLIVKAYRRIGTNS